MRIRTAWRRIFGCLDGFAVQVAVPAQLQFKAAYGLDVLLPSIIENVFKGELYYGKEKSIGLPAFGERFA